MIDHKEVLTSTARLLAQRTEAYGVPAHTYARAATIASTVLGKDLTPYDIVMVMHAVKLSRIPSDPKKLDNYRDGINYLAFAAEFIGATEASQKPSNDDMFRTFSMRQPTPPRAAVAVDLDKIEAEISSNDVMADV